MHRIYRHNTGPTNNTLMIEIENRPADCFAWISPDGQIGIRVDSTIALTRHYHPTISDESLAHAEQDMLKAIESLHDEVA